jgi:uncharacterized iron-regulated membrane protein
MMSIERLLKTIHSWLGVLILPWVILAGLTGLYMNHRDLVLSVFPQTSFDPATFDTAPEAQVQDQSSALLIARAAVPDAPLRLLADTSHDHRTVFTIDAGTQDVIVDAATGFYWIDSRYRTAIFTPDGRRVFSSVKWKKVLSSLHARGWVGSTFGTWLADIAAAALAVFGITGLVLFALPRLRRYRNRRARLAFQKASAARADVSPAPR